MSLNHPLPSPNCPALNPALNCRFAIISDLHVALPHTIWNHPSRFHLVEVSIPALEIILERLQDMALDFLLLPGDLTQHGEADNHHWLAQRLAQLPYPVYVVPGNHDVPVALRDNVSIGMSDFPSYYRQFGYAETDQLYYTQELSPGLRLIGLNSTQFTAQGEQIGRVDAAQLAWLETVLATYPQDLILVMIHHNVVEHLPNQSRHPLGRRYMLSNAPELRSILQKFGVELVFTGHLHVQDVACAEGLYDITTGSLVSYPHPYRVLDLQSDRAGQHHLHIASGRVEAVPNWTDLQRTSRDWLGERSHPFMQQLLLQPPLNLSLPEAEGLLPALRYFWADVANGDTVFDFSHFPPLAQKYFEAFGAIDAAGQAQAIDNAASLPLRLHRPHRQQDGEPFTVAEKCQTPK
jgi:predicted phosphodiesterase